MTVAQLIEELKRIASDPTSGVTMDTPVEHEHPDGGMSEKVATIYAFKHGGTHLDKLVVMISGVEPEN